MVGSQGWAATNVERRELGSLIDSLRDDSLTLMEQIDELEGRFREREPGVQAFVQEENRFQRLREEAEHLIRRFPEAASRPPLFGVPLGVKDIFHVEGFPTRAGSQLPPERLAGPEAAVVTALKMAGVLVLGKTVTTEFAFFAPGPTRNPHNLAHTPGGSSSGSAAAVAAGLCPLALGTQTIGSVNGRLPSVVSSDLSLVTIESRARESFLSRPLSITWASSRRARGARGGLLPYFAPNGGRLRWHRRRCWGIPHGPYLDKASAEGRARFENMCARLDEEGLTLKRVSAFADFERIVERHYDLVAADAAAVHEEWYADFPDRYHRRTRELIERGRKLGGQAMEAARSGRDAFRRRLAARMDDEGVNLWIAPAAPGAAPAGLGSTGDPVMNLPWTYGGLPAISLPGGTNEKGLPLGVQFVGRWYGDEALLRWAERLETTVRAG